MADQYIPYDDMVHNALLSVVRDVLSDTARSGLPGAHHFYIAFRTDHPGVIIPPHLKERYKDEMTIVIQNQYWDLKVEPDYFEVGLSFSGKSSILTIPFAAITGFLDPSVEFGLQFQRTKDAAANGDEIAETPTPEPESNGDETPKTPEGGDANVVTLDAFRKKK